MRTTSAGGARYFVLFIDDYSRYAHVEFIATKDVIPAIFDNYRRLVENHHDSRIKALRTDGGGEYCSNAFEDYLRSHGIAHQTTAPYTPEQNGVVERMNRTIGEMARCLLHAKSLPNDLWPKPYALPSTSATALTHGPSQA